MKKSFCGLEKIYIYFKTVFTEIIKILTCIYRLLGFGIFIK